ncbi:MAG: TonB-dependent receptor [Odoribacteraceae bacterium]|jgi:hypothetical protein|nr:TonB-dependent receptor [Odoribacteraceae bacterium]
MKEIYRIIVRHALVLGLLTQAFPLFAQKEKFTVSGTITNSDTGEGVPGTNITVTGLKQGTVAGPGGHYSIVLPRGKYILAFSCVGYTHQKIAIDLVAEKKLHVTLVPRVEEIEEVTVTAEARELTRPETGIERLPPRAIKRIPALMGEVDVIKAIQLLPGVQPTSEGSSGFSVRGGSHDQNLVLLDEATLYNASHLMGFFSIFNNDAIQEVALYKGDIPASFGGRLSSLLDIRSKEGNNLKTTTTGGIGLISSRLTVDGPLARERASFLVAGRRSYADLFLAFASDKNLRSTTLYFYDLNARVDYHPGKNDHLYVTGYLGKDKFANKSAGMTFSNRSLVARWSHRFSPRLLAHLTLFTSSYDYYIKSELSKQLTQDWASSLSSSGLKIDLTRYTGNATIKAGYNVLFHRFLPGEGGGIGDEALFARVKHPTQFALEHALYATGELSPGERLTIRAGFRVSLFHNIANGKEVKYLQEHAYHHSRFPARGTIYHTYHHIEPRLGVTFRLDETRSMKASYTRSVQHVQVASNSTSGSPLDIWFHASPNVKPQRGEQVAVGYVQKFRNDIELSVELYHRLSRDVIDFKDHASLLGNEDLEQEIRAGKGTADGIECMIRKNTGRITGWASYTYARSRRETKGINNDKPYRSPNDKPHAITLVTSLELSPAWNISANWVYATGHPVTYPTGRFLVENTYVPLYSGRNEFRFPDYHRLDLSATRQLSRPNARLKSEINISLYNAYGRKNPWSIFFRQEKEQPDISYAEQIYLFSVVPSITWNFTF